MLTSLVLLALSSASAAQVSTGGSFAITRSTVDNGGSPSAGGAFVLQGTVAQPESAPEPALGGDFAVAGGFWTRGPLEPPSDGLFNDRFEALDPRQ
ncbi:MAG: hypothetical protein AAGJ52_02810 [Pseudomonadota bacterium]